MISVSRRAERGTHLEEQSKNAVAIQYQCEERFTEDGKYIL